MAAADSAAVPTGPLVEISIVGIQIFSILSKKSLEMSSLDFLGEFVLNYCCLTD